MLPPGANSRIPEAGPLYPFEGATPQVAPDTFIAPIANNYIELSERYLRDAQR